MHNKILQKVYSVKRPKTPLWVETTVCSLSLAKTNLQTLYKMEPKKFNATRCSLNLKQIIKTKELKDKDKCKQESTMNISQLANDNLSLILNCISLPNHRLLNLRSVSVRFNEVISSMLRSRKSLKLFGSTYSFLWQYSALVRLQQEDITGGQNIDANLLQDVIRLRGLRLTDAEQMISKLFPNVDTIFFCNITNNQVRYKS